MKSRKLEQLRRCNNLLKIQSFVNYERFLEVLLRSIHTDLSSKLLVALQGKEYKRMIDLADSVSSTVFETAAEHRLCHQLSAVIRKYPFPEGSVDLDPHGAAMRTFLKSEHKCKRINQRFSAYRKVRSPHEYALNQARSWISYVLGPLRLSEIWDNCDFGPGASVGVHGNATNAARKLLSKSWSVSPSAFYYGYAAVMRDDHIRELLSSRDGSLYYGHDNFLLFESYKARTSYVSYNKIAFVPKTAKTERTIAVEPVVNGYVQKGVDLFMRKRLKRVGIDLSDQTVNQELARKGSLPNTVDPYVTIDLSSASDSISIGLCRDLLPVEWFDFLDSLRSRNCWVEGVISPYHKFVTMGNGFCFPLETLIFASLCHVACNESNQKADFSVYGDDIIVRSSVADRVLQLLGVCGFTANLKKTHLRGPFRESCGADWFEGKDVRPLSLDYAFDSVENIFKFCNLSRSKGAWECIFYEACQFLISLIPKELMFTRPYSGQVDTALEVPYDVFLSSKFSKWHNSTMSWSWLELVKIAVADKQPERVTGYPTVLMRGAVNGSMSSVPFAERRKTRTKIRRINGSGGWCTFLPGSAPP